MAQQDPQLTNLLKWSIENTTPSSDSTPQPAARTPNAAALSALFQSQPSDAELMQASMAALQNPEVSVADKLVAFDNFEQLVEGIDNANNMLPLGLWAPLILLLEDADTDMRRMAAWCVGTAVQNNPAAQKAALDGGAVERLVHMVKTDQGATRKKAAYAISSEVRNFQPGLDKVLAELSESQNIDAGDMDAIDQLVGRLRADA